MINITHSQLTLSVSPDCCTYTCLSLWLSLLSAVVAAAVFCLASHHLSALPSSGRRFSIMCNDSVLSAGFQIDTPDSLGRTCLHAAAAGGWAKSFIIGHVSLNNERRGLKDTSGLRHLCFFVLDIILRTSQNSDVATSCHMMMIYDQTVLQKPPNLNIPSKL